MGAPRKKAKCAARQWTIQIDFDLKSKKSIQIMRLAAGSGKSPDSSGGHANFDQPWHGGVGQHVNDLVGVDGHGVQQNGWTASHAAKHTALRNGKKHHTNIFLMFLFFLVLFIKSYFFKNAKALMKLSIRI
jgi:hypothetical protein